MSRRPAKSQSLVPVAPAPKRPRLEGWQAGAGSKTKFVRALADLQRQGVLAGPQINESTCRRQVRATGTAHADATTPYGTVVQHFDVGVTGERTDCVDPAAWLYYMCTISTAFTTMMEAIIDGGARLRIALYNDGVVPGNPFRPEHARKLEAFYWSIIDWPDHVLKRTFAWPVFCLIRSKIVDKVIGGLSAVAGMVLERFRALFTTGVFLPLRGGVVVTFIFVGFLADLVAHKELTCWKGHGGARACLNCPNLRTGRRAADDIGLDCWDETAFLSVTSADIFDIVDSLQRAEGTIGVTAFKALQTRVGFNVDRHGLMGNPEYREFYSPATHHLRDWMHIIGCDGVANSEIHAVAQRLQSVMAITREQIRDFSLQCHLPTMYGKVSAEWFHPSRFKKKTISSFAGYILSMVPIMVLLLEHFGCEVRLPVECECFRTLWHIIGVLRSGPTTSAGHAHVLKALIRTHHKLFVQLYKQYLKPKQHHLHHVVDVARWLGKIPSCFVTERKHKDVKKYALNCFRHFEHSVTRDVLQEQCVQMCSGDDIFRERFLHNPKMIHTPAGGMGTSHIAMLKFGDLHRGDIVYTYNGVAGRIVAFWQKDTDAQIVLELDAYSCVGGETQLRDERRSTRTFFDEDDIVDACLWVYSSAHIIRLCVPPVTLF